MPASRTRAVLGALTALGVGLGITLAGANSAQAASTTTLAFVTTTTTVEFGGDWVAQLHLSTADGWVVLDTESGTIDVLVDGIAGVFSDDIPLFRGGDAFVTQPNVTPPLGAGVHSLTAIFTPAPGSNLVSSKTSVPFKLTVTPFDLIADASLSEVPGDKESPYVELQTSGAYVDARGTPHGSWSITVEREGDEVLSTEVAQAEGSESLFVALGSAARPGTTLRVSAEFVPDAAVAPGIDVTQAEPIVLELPPLTPVEFLTTSVQQPWWLVAVLSALILGAISGLVVVLVRRRRPAVDDVSDSTVSPTR